MIYKNTTYKLLNLGNIQVLKAKLGDSFFVTVLQILLL